MIKTRVVHCWREVYDILIDRTTKWGNPFHVWQYGREGCLKRYEEWLPAQPQLLADLHELSGKTLGCWCKPPEGFKGRLLCHGQVLAGLCDNVPPESIE